MHFPPYAIVQEQEEKETFKMGRNESGGRRGELNAFFGASSQRHSTMMMAHSTNVDSASLGFDKKKGDTYVRSGGGGSPSKAGVGRRKEMLPRKPPRTFSQAEIEQTGWGKSSLFSFP